MVSNFTAHFWSLKHYQSTSTCLIYRPRGAMSAQSQRTQIHHSGWSAQLLWERKFTTWRLTKWQVNSVVRLFPDFKNKKVHTSSLYIITGLQPDCLCEWWRGLWVGEISPYCLWRCWWNRARGSTALPAEIDTKLLLLRLLFPVPKHWPTAPH